VNRLQALIASIRAADTRSICWRARPVGRGMMLRFSTLCLCSVWAGCSLHTGDALNPQKVLGVADVIEVPTQNRRRLDDFTCGPRLLICEDRVGKLRCRCSEAAIVEIP
jgi:hypothetical protein